MIFKIAHNKMISAFLLIEFVFPSHEDYNLTNLLSFTKKCRNNYLNILHRIVIFLLSSTALIWYGLFYNNNILLTYKLQFFAFYSS